MKSQNRCGEESPSRKGRRWWLTATRGNPRDSATENTQPMSRTKIFVSSSYKNFSAGQVKVKWCGKSAPR